MTKADSKKLILFNVLEEYFYIAVIYLLALNFFVQTNTDCTLTIQGVCFWYKI